MEILQFSNYPHCLYQVGKKKVSFVYPYSSLREVRSENDPVFELSKVELASSVDSIEWL